MSANIIRTDNNGYSYIGTIDFNELGNNTHSHSESDITGLISDLAAKIGVANFIIGEVPSGIVDGTNNTFIIAYTPVTNKEIIYIDGIRQKRGTDYTISSGTITFSTAPPSGSDLTADYLK